MKYLLITIHDRAVNAFEAIGNVRAEGEALRVFHDLIGNEQTKYHKHAADYDLYMVGSFDDQDGSITPEKPRKIADGKSVKEMQANN